MSTTRGKKKEQSRLKKQKQKQNNSSKLNKVKTCNQQDTKYPYMKATIKRSKQTKHKKELGRNGIIPLKRFVRVTKVPHLRQSMVMVLDCLWESWLRDCFYKPFHTFKIRLETNTPYNTLQMDFETTASFDTLQMDFGTFTSFILFKQFWG